MTSMIYTFTLSSTSVQPPRKIGDNTIIYQSPMYLKQGRRWDCAHRARALTLEPPEREQSWSPPLASPRHQGPHSHAVSSRLSPCGTESFSLGVFPWDKGTSISAASKLFSGNIALNFKNQTHWKKNCILQQFFRNISTILLMHILHKYHVLIMG